MRCINKAGGLLIFLLSILMLCPMRVSAQPEKSTQIYVAPNGNDENSGTIDSPLKTLKKAQEKVRVQTSSMSNDIEIILRDGVYHLDSTLVLTGEDSGKNGFKVIYKAYEGETPVISGGKPVTGWSLYDEEKNIYCADVSGFGKDFDTRQLYVEGVRATRAKGDAAGSDFSKGNGFYNINADGKYKDMASWKNQSDIEMQSTVTWKNHRLPVTSIADGKVNIEPVFWTSAHTQNVCTPGAINMVENAFELLDEENEWYFDKSDKKIFYKPAEEQNVNELDIVAGKLEYILQAEGTAANPVKNIELNGLQFSYNTWLMPNTEFGYADFQGGAVYKNTTNSHEWVETNYQTEAGVEFNYAKDCIVEKCTFTSMGNAALSFLDGSENNVISHNKVFDVSGNGIMLGSIYKEAHQNEPAEGIVRGNEIGYNTVHNIGAEYLDNVGIFVGYTKETNIHHNTLYDLPYTGISMGWGWGETDMLGPSVAGENTISHNLIHDYMGILHDGGGIYTLGEQYNSKVYNNYIYNNGGSNFVLYRDNGSAGILDTNNVVKASEGVNRYYFSTNYAPLPCHSSNDNASVGNYYTAGMTSQGPGINNNIEMDNIGVAQDNWPEGAVSVMQNAGTEGGMGEIPDLSQPNYGEYETEEDNIAISAKASSSSDYSEEYQASYAIDNKKHTRWSAKSGAASGEWIMLEFDKEYTVDKVQLVLPQGKDYQYKYTIEYSLDGNEWLKWYDQNTYTDSQVNTYELWGDPAAARYVRVTFNDTGRKGCGLIEFKVYKTDKPMVEKVSVMSCAGANGTISPNGVTEIGLGKTVQYDIVPDEGYLINNVLVDGVDQGKVNSYIFEDIQSSHLISATFVKKPIKDYEKLDIVSGKASTNYSKDYNADKAFDGDWDNTRWSAASGKVSDEWLEVDLGTENNVDKIRLKNHPFKNNNFKFKIQYSNDETEEKSWTDAVIQDVYTESAEMSYELEESVNARFFRVYFTDTDGNGCSVYEFELSASKGEVEIPKTANTVTFLSNGGALVQSQFIEDGESAIEPESPTRNGYLFAGWYSDAECTSVWEFDKIITADCILYAKWDEIQQVKNVTADPEPGTYTSPQNVNLNSLTQDAKIYYTTDGTMPTEKSSEFTASIYVDETTTIKAVAIKENMKNSDAAEFVYTISKEEPVEPDPDPDPNPGPDPTPDPDPAAGLEVEFISEIGTPEVSVTVDDWFRDAVLTAQEKQQLEDGMPIKLQINIKKAMASEQEQEQIKAALAGRSLGQILDISVTKQVGNDPVQEIHSLNQPVKMLFHVTDEYKEPKGKLRTFTVLHLGSQGVEDYEDQDKEPDTVTIECDSFSLYAFAYKDSEKNSSDNNADTKDPVKGGTSDKKASSVKTGDKAPVIPAVVLLVFSTGVIAWMVKKKIKQ